MLPEAAFDLSVAPVDGLPDRDAGPWVVDKLEIHRRYVEGFVRACSRRARHWFYVEGFASRGVNRIRTTGERVWGTPLIALAAEPAFTRCLFVEMQPKSARILQQRVATFGNRAVVRQGDCNAVLVPLLEEHVDRWAPCLCVLDPEGFDLPWPTVVRVAAFRNPPRKVEQLILFPDPGVLREQGLKNGITLFAERDLTSLYGHERWRSIRDMRAAEEISPEEARRQYVDLYKDGLRALGYRHVIDRPILERGAQGIPLYTLIFASDHEAGERIMRDAFGKVAREATPQRSLPGMGLQPPGSWSER